MHHAPYAMNQSNQHHLLTNLIYTLSLLLYLHPLTLSPTPSLPSTTSWSLITHPPPQLDELHILQNDDVTASNTWGEAWHNDYWGRSLDSESSHKSWRPVTVWSFRFARGQSEKAKWLFGKMGQWMGMLGDFLQSLVGSTKANSANIQSGENIGASPLFIHRFINVLIHACLVRLIGVLSLLLFPNQYATSLLSQLLFSFHPTHVEAVTNAANRPHILGLLFNLAIEDPSFPLVGVGIGNALALLSAETALFHLPAVLVTMVAIRYREMLNTSRERGWEKNKEKEEHSSSSILTKTIISLTPRFTILFLTTSLYLTHRLLNSSLSIPKGLIRPAENPYYSKFSTWSLLRRMMNYSYITSLHVLKSWGVEVIGMSHEYGYDCVPELRVGDVDGIWVVDLRLSLPLLLIVLALGLVVYCWNGSLMPKQQSATKECAQCTNLEEDRTMRILLLLVFFAWMATLFPIAGILKVGTFIADRIVVASTVGTCIFGGRAIAIWILGREDETNTQQPSRQKSRVIKTALVLVLCTKYLAVRTHNRAAEWMDSVPLLESSLRACPKSIKSNLEMSKLFSGLVPHMVDFEKALTLIETAQSIDPTYCDVHQQFGHVYFQQGRYILFEEAMVQSLMCPFTMGQAMNNWKRYWNAVLQPRNGVVDAEARGRYDGYMKRIEESIEKEAEREARNEAFERRGRAAAGSDLEEEL